MTKVSSRFETRIEKLATLLIIVHSIVYNSLVWFVGV